MPRGVKWGATLAGVALAVGLMLFFLLGASNGGTERVRGTRAGNLDAGSVVGASFALRRGQSYMLGLDYLKNVGHDPILVERVQPQSNSLNLRATQARIWLVPRDSHLSLPGGWPGWPPKHPPTKRWRGDPKSWVQPHPVILSLPTSRTLPPGREAQLMYGIFLHSEPNAKTRITALRIRFKQDGRTFLWTLPEPVRVLRAH